MSDLRRALEPFVEFARWVPEEDPDDAGWLDAGDEEQGDSYVITSGNFRRACRALQEIEG